MCSRRCLNVPANDNNRIFAALRIQRVTSRRLTVRYCHCINYSFNFTSSPTTIITLCCSHDARVVCFTSRVCGHNLSGRTLTTRVQTRNLSRIKRPQGGPVANTRATPRRIVCYSYTRPGDIRSLQRCNLRTHPYVGHPNYIGCHVG